MRKRLLTGATAACVLAATPLVGAHASVILSLVSEAPTTGGYDYTYGATLSQDEQLDTSVQPVFFTIYDFGTAALQGTTGTLSSDWTFQLDTPQLTPAEGTAPNNNTSIDAIRATYSGPVETGPDLGTGQDNLGTFTLFTTVSGSYSIENNVQDAQLEKYAPGSSANDTPTSNLAALAIPTPAPVPEPAPLAVIGCALLGLAAVRRVRG